MPIVYDPKEVAVSKIIYCIINNKAESIKLDVKTEPKYIEPKNQKKNQNILTS